MKSIISKKSENNLKCICGLCKHTYSNSSCIYNKIVDAQNPEDKMFKEIMKIIKEEKKNDNRQQKKQPKSK